MIKTMKNLMESIVRTSGLSRWYSPLEHYLAGMMMTAIIGPGLATAGTLIMAIGGWVSNDQALFLGIGAGLIGWLVSAAVAQYFVSIHRASPAVYRQLCSRVEILKAQMDKIQNKMKQDARQEDPIVYALAEIEEYQRLLTGALGESSKDDCLSPKDGFPLDWIGASGYIRLWELLHRAEETRLLLAPLETVRAAACDDELRLTGSNIANRDVLITSLHSGREYLKKSFQASLERLELPGSPEKRNLTEVEKAQEFTGREMLRYIRRSINEFRDEQRMSLARARNRLLKTVVLTECICFALAALAVVAGATATNLTAAVAFFLVGAVVGLFNQLHMDASSETGTEDYGLTTIRLLHTPLFSGLAALGGVLLIPLLTSLGNGTTGAPLASTPVNLEQVFNLKATPFNFVLAAIFGLTPTVLISRLQEEAEKYKSDLRSSDAIVRGSVQPGASLNAAVSGSSTQPVPQPG